MTRINTNVASLRGLRNLNRANNLLDTSLTRLSTGLQINSGRDNPAGLIASETLRSQITTIEQSIRNSNRANNVLGTTDSALGEITGLLNQIRGLVQEGLNEGALSQEEIEANQLQIDAALSAINRISANTSFAGDKLIDGSGAYRTTATTADAAKFDDFQINSAIFAGSSNIVLDATVTTAATKGQLLYDFVSGGLASDTVLEVSGKKGTDVVFLGSGSSLDNVKTAIDALSDVTGVEVSKTAAVAGTAIISSTAANADFTVTDKRVSTGDQGVFAQTLRIAIAAAAPSQTLDVASASTATELTLTITLATDAGGLVTSSANDVKARLLSDADSSDFVLVTVEGTGAGTVDAGLAAESTTGQDNAFLTFRSSDFGSDQFVGINVLQGTFATTNLSAAASTREVGTDIVATINGQAALGKGLKASLRTSQVDASLNFTSAANVAATNAKITITGGGSLFQIGQEANAAGQLGIGIDAVNTARLGGLTGKLYELGSGGGKSLLDVGPTVPGSDLVSIIEDALSRVSTLRGRIGAVQKNVIETNISTLGSALENISASRSEIVDTDFAQETAALTRAQILSQSGISVLTIANQNPANVLALLG
ncbi:MAG: hypothetical protein KY476_17210 [Planctomycetes bacterium]|nr:hypothetical protein [Planctomycetota bacterium]